MEETILEQIRNSFGNFNEDILELIQDLTQSPEAFNSSIWGIVTRIFNTMLPISYTLLAIFFIMDFLGKSTRFEFMRWENIVKALLKLIVAKLVIENSFRLLTIIFEVVAGLIHNTASVGMITVPEQMEMEMVRTELEGMGFFQQLMFSVSISPWNLIMSLLRIVIFLIIYGRMIEIYVLTAVAPLPLSTLSNENLHGTAKKFIQHYVAVCMQGLIILLCCMIYGGLMQNIGGNPTDVWESVYSTVLTSGVLLLMLIKSGSWAKTICGVGA